MIAIVFLGGLALAGYYVTQPGSGNGSTADYGIGAQGSDRRYHMDLKNKQEAGIFWGTQRTQLLNVTNLNDAWKPRGAPAQKPTRSMFEFLTGVSETDSYLEKYGREFYFLRDPEIPLANAEQSNPNVEVPSQFSSIRGDPGNTLLNYPRVYVDYHGKNPHLFSNNPKTWNAGEPTEWEEQLVPQEGQVNREFNPWGPGGVLQSLFAYRNENVTRNKKCNRATAAVPPPTKYYNNKYY